MRDTRRTRLVLVVLLLVAFALITLDYRSGSGSPFNRLRSGAAAVFGPIERGVGGAARSVGSAFTTLGHLGSYKSQVADLQARNAKLEQQLRLSADDGRQLAAMSALLHLAGAGRYRILPARVTAIGDALGFEWTVTIDAGSDAGLRPNMTVLNGQGLVGRVVSTGPSTATVALAISSEVNVGARLEGSGQIGYVRGGGLGPLTFTLLDSNAPLRAGQRLVTFGSTGDAPYVPEVPIGTVTTIAPSLGGLTRTAQVTPFVDFSTLDIVGVVVDAPKRIPRDSVLPPRPTASASPSPAPAAKHKRSSGKRSGTKRSPSPSPSP